MKNKFTLANFELLLKKADGYLISEYLANIQDSGELETKAIAIDTSIASSLSQDIKKQVITTITESPITSYKISNSVLYKLIDNIFNIRNDLVVNNSFVKTLIITAVSNDTKQLEGYLKEFSDFSSLEEKARALNLMIDKQSGKKEADTLVKFIYSLPVKNDNIKSSTFLKLIDSFAKLGDKFDIKEHFKDGLLKAALLVIENEQSVTKEKLGHILNLVKDQSKDTTEFANIIKVGSLEQIKAYLISMPDITSLEKEVEVISLFMRKELAKNNIDITSVKEFISFIKKIPSQEFETAYEVKAAISIIDSTKLTSEQSRDLIKMVKTSSKSIDDFEKIISSGSIADNLDQLKDCLLSIPGINSLDTRAKIFDIIITTEASKKSSSGYVKYVESFYNYINNFSKKEPTKSDAATKEDIKNLSDFIKKLPLDYVDIKVDAASKMIDSIMKYNIDLADIEDSFKEGIAKILLPILQSIESSFKESVAKFSLDITQRYIKNDKITFHNNSEKFNFYLAQTLGKPSVAKNSLDKINLLINLVSGKDIGFKLEDIKGASIEDFLFTIGILRKLAKRPDDFKNDIKEALANKALECLDSIFRNKLGEGWVVNNDDNFFFITDFFENEQFEKLIKNAPNLIKATGANDETIVALVNKYLMKLLQYSKDYNQPNFEKLKALLVCNIKNYKDIKNIERIYLSEFDENILKSINKTELVLEAIKNQNFALIQFMYGGGRLKITDEESVNIFNRLIADTYDNELVIKYLAETFKSIPQAQLSQYLLAKVKALTINPKDVEFLFNKEFFDKVQERSYFDIMKASYKGTNNALFFKLLETYVDALEVELKKGGESLEQLVQFVFEKQDAHALKILKKVLTKEIIDDYIPKFALSYIYQGDFNKEILLGLQLIEKEIKDVGSWLGYISSFMPTHIGMFGYKVDITKLYPVVKDIKIFDKINLKDAIVDGIRHNLKVSSEPNKYQALIQLMKKYDILNTDQIKVFADNVNNIDGAEKKEVVENNIGKLVDKYLEKVINGIIGSQDKVKAQLKAVLEDVKNKTFDDNIVKLKELLPLNKHYLLAKDVSGKKENEFLEEKIIGFKILFDVNKSHIKLVLKDIFYNNNKGFYNNVKELKELLPYNKLIQDINHYDEAFLLMYNAVVERISDDYFMEDVALTGIYIDKLAQNTWVFKGVNCDYSDDNINMLFKFGHKQGYEKSNILNYSIHTKWNNPSGKVVIDGETVTLDKQQAVDAVNKNSVGLVIKAVLPKGSLQVLGSHNKYGDLVPNQLHGWQIKSVFKVADNKIIGEEIMNPYFEAPKGEIIEVKFEDIHGHTAGTDEFSNRADYLAKHSGKEIEEIEKVFFHTIDYDHGL